jgi:glutathione S-transferase
VILIGQYDSPFVRRVGVALTLRGIAFEHRPWSVFGDGERVRAFNPLMRVPTLVLADGEAILDSHAMIDHIESLTPDGEAMLPRHEPARRRALRIMSLALGLAEQAVSLFYEVRLHETVSDVLTARRQRQITDAAAALEAASAALTTPFHGGDRIGHADIAVAVCFQFVKEAHPGLLDMTQSPALSRFSAQAEALPAFQTIRQPFIPPA